MVIATGQTALAADVNAPVNAAAASAAAAQAAATSAAQLAGAADTHATTALGTATTASADAATAKAQVGGLQQQITNTAADRTANKTSIDQHTADIGALTNRILALEGGTPPAVPNSPTNPTSTAVTPTSVSLSATAPVGGAAPTSYKWEYKRSVDTAFLVSSVVTLTGTQSGLAASTAYNFRVSAVNAAGPSPPSAVYTVSTSTATTLVESAHATAATTTTSPPIIDAALNSWTLISASPGVGDFQIAINGVRQTDTNDVTLMKYYNPTGAAVAGTTKHSVVHQNISGDWYIATSVTANIATWAQLTGDPFATVVTPPPPTGNAPGPAQSAGFLVQTFGPGLTLGSRGTSGANWYPQGSGSVSQLANNKLFIQGGSSDFNYEVVTAEPQAGMAGVGNRSFGGGGYFEMLLSMENPGSTGGPRGWPGFWANDIEAQAGGTRGSLAHWPGMPAGYGMWFEPDIMEFQGPNNQYGVQIHQWYSTTDGPDAPLPLPQINIGSANIADPHYYGWLWVPATRTTKGKAAFFFDRVEMSTFIYDYFDRNNPPPGPPANNNMAGGMDTTPNDDGRHFQLIIGTGDNNSFTVHEVSVWQKDGSKNLFT